MLMDTVEHLEASHGLLQDKVAVLQETVVVTKQEAEQDAAKATKVRLLRPSEWFRNDMQHGRVSQWGQPRGRVPSYCIDSYRKAKSLEADA